MLYRSLFRPLLFLLDAETAHRLAAWWLGIVHRTPWLRRLLRTRHAPALEVTAFGLTFASPIVLAAGFDKGAEMYNALGAMGFAGVEIGTVTALPQPGNPRPRLFRLPRDHAVINRMGFNNAGAAAVEQALAAHPPEFIRLGVNLGKSKVTDLERAAEDYAESARRLGRFADYVVINVSSPNTPGLRSLQSVEALRPIVVAVQRELAALPRAAPPLLVKIAPDLSDEDIDAVVDFALEARLAGIIATNTTVERDSLGLNTPRNAVERIGAGGLSGRPLRRRALAVIRRVHARCGGGLTVVGVGGIETADDVWETLQAGATLVQVYTGLLYAGPGFARELEAGLVARMAREGVTTLQAVVGTGNARA